MALGWSTVMVSCWWMMVELFNDSDQHDVYKPIGCLGAIILIFENALLAGWNSSEYLLISFNFSDDLRNSGVRTSCGSISSDSSGCSLEDNKLITFTVISLPSALDPALVDTPADPINFFECLLTLIAEQFTVSKLEAVHCF